MSQQQDLDIKSLFVLFWNEKLKIISITTIFSLVGVLVAINLPNIYKSEAVIVPVENDTSEMSKIMSGQLGGLAQMAGIKSTSNREYNSLIAIEILKSRKFFEAFSKKYNVLVPLMASSGWDESENKLIIDEQMYDLNKKKWVREVEYPKKPQPSIDESHRVFLENLSIARDKVTGIIRIGFKHYSPYIAKEWTTQIVSEINQTMKEQDVEQAKLSIEYLKKEINNTQLSELKTSLYSLIQQQVQTIMLAEASPEYLFKTIDPAIVPELKIEPKRPMIAIITFIIGFLSSIIFIIILRYKDLVKNTSLLND